MSKYVMAIIKLPDNMEVLSKDAGLALKVKGGSFQMNHWISVPACEFDSTEKLRECIEAVNAKQGE